MTCNTLQQPELPSSTSNILLCALGIGHDSVLKNVVGATSPQAPPAQDTFTCFVGPVSISKSFLILSKANL